MRQEEREKGRQQDREARIIAERMSGKGKVEKGDPKNCM